jgi:hypothetical protein
MSTVSASNQNKINNIALEYIRKNMEPGLDQYDKYLNMLPQNERERYEYVLTLPDQSAADFDQHVRDLKQDAMIHSRNNYRGQQGGHYGYAKEFRNPYSGRVIQNGGYTHRKIMNGTYKPKHHKYQYGGVDETTQLYTDLIDFLPAKNRYHYATAATELDGEHLRDLLQDVLITNPEKYGSAQFRKFVERYNKLGYRPL